MWGNIQSAVTFFNRTGRIFFLWGQYKMEAPPQLFPKNLLWNFRGQLL